MFLFVRVIEDAPLLKKTESFFLKSYFIVFRTSKITLKANKEKTPTIKFKFTGPSFLSRKNLKKDFKKREHFTRIKPFESGIFFFFYTWNNRNILPFFSKIKGNSGILCKPNVFDCFKFIFFGNFWNPVSFFRFVQLFFNQFFYFGTCNKSRKIEFFFTRKNHTLGLGSVWVNRLVFYFYSGMGFKNFLHLLSFFSLFFRLSSFLKNSRSNWLRNSSFKFIGFS